MGSDGGCLGGGGGSRSPRSIVCCDPSIRGCLFSSGRLQVPCEAATNVIGMDAALGIEPRALLWHSHPHTHPLSPSLSTSPRVWVNKGGKHLEKNRPLTRQKSPTPGWTQQPLSLWLPSHYLHLYYSFAGYRWNLMDDFQVNGMIRKQKKSNGMCMTKGWASW